MLTFDPSTNSLQFSGGGCVISDWRLCIEAQGRLLESPRAEAELLRESPLRFKLSFPSVGLEWEVACEEDEATGRLHLHSSLENRSEHPISLGKCFLLHSSKPVRVGEPADDIVCLPLAGSITERRVHRLTDSDCPRESKIKLQLYNRTDHKAMQVGFLTFQRADTVVEYNWQQSAGITNLRASCDYAGWELPPGASTATETFSVAVGDDPFAQLEQWAELAAPLSRARDWQEAPIGWVGWAWVDPFTVETYEEVVLRNCSAIRKRLSGFDIKYVWVSIGNLDRGIPGNWLEWDYGNFPNGPEHLAARLREMEFKWGLWCAPFWMCSLLEDKVGELRDALLKSPDGSPLVVRPEWQYGVSGKMPKAERPCIHALDPTHPQTLELLKDTFETYRKWGVRYYMIDFLEAGAGNVSRFPYTEHYDHAVVAGPEAYHKALAVIRQAAGDDTYFLSSSGPTVHNAGMVDGARVGNDFGEGRALYPDSYFYPATFVIGSRKFWTGASRALGNQASAYYTHRKLYINDSGNVLTVDKPLSLNDAQIHATIHAMSGGPTMLGDDVDRMDEDRLAIIKKTLPRSRDVAFPVDLFDSAFPDYPKIFHRKVTKSWGTYDVVAIYNFGDELLSVPIELSRLRLNADAGYIVWEFWNGEYVGKVTGSLVATVPPGTVKVYRLVEDTGVPTLLGTDMHLLMGEMEIHACAWHAEKRTLSGTALRPSGERGNVFIHAPANVRVTNPRGHWIAKDARDNSLVIRVSLVFENGRADWKVSFADLKEVLDMDRLDLA